MSSNPKKKYPIKNRPLNISLVSPKKHLKNTNQIKIKFDSKNINVKKENMRTKLDHILKLLNANNKTQLNIEKQNTPTNKTNNNENNEKFSKEKKPYIRNIKNLKLDLYKSSSVETFPNKRKKFIYYRNNYVFQKKNLFPSTQKNLTKGKQNNIFSKINKKKYKKENNNIYIDADKIDYIYDKFFKNKRKKPKKEKSAENFNKENFTKSYSPIEEKEKPTSISFNGIENINKFPETCKSNRTNNYSTSQITAKDENSFIIKYFDKNALTCDNINNKNIKNYNYSTVNYNYNKNNDDYNYNLRNNLIKKIKILYDKDKNHVMKLNMASKKKINNKRKEKLLNLIENYGKNNKFKKGIKCYFRHWKYIKDEKKIKANKLKKYKKDRKIRINNIVYAPDFLDCLFEIVDVNENLD